MLGKIINYIAELKSGIILGSDQKHYTFHAKQWLDPKPPSIGSEVNFEIDHSAQVSAVYFTKPSNSHQILIYPPEYIALLQQEMRYSILDWFIKCIRHYARFNGRARRKEFWYFYLGQSILIILALLLDWLFGTRLLFYCSVAFSLILPSIAVTIRRLHDVNRSGWYSLMLILPLANFLVLFWLCSETKNTSNRWGAPAK